jgi:hypothetical protein
MTTLREAAQMALEQLRELTEQKKALLASPLLERVLNVLVNRCDPSDPIIKEVREAVESSRIAPEQTLRDFFAAQAMQSLIVTNSETNTMRQIAETAYLLADAMIKERDA